MKKKQKMLKCFKQFILLIFFVSACAAFIAIYYLNFKEMNRTIEYVGSTNIQVKLYDKDKKEILSIPRGDKVAIINEIDKDYTLVSYQAKEYLISKINLVKSIKEVVMEKKMYVRTPVTLYLATGLSLIKKGEELEIMSYETLNSDGTVNRYFIKYNGLEGYVYSKYLTNTKESALLNYDETGKYTIHASRKNVLGGGSAANLDFYPVIKTEIQGNVMPTETRSLYLNGGVIRRVDEYITLAKTMNINAFVVDIKDNISPAYKSPVMEQYSPTNFKYAINSFDNYKAAIKKLKDNGFYVIGRITVFKDSYYVKDHPEVAIMDTRTGGLFDHNGSYWPSAYQRPVWEFNVALAKEAVKEMGFNEIQFDYVRFPDRTYQLEKSGAMDLKNIYNEEKAQAIQAFVMYASDELHQAGAYISVDVFGEAAHNYVTGYGQYWGAISNVVDVISPMPYPDHFGAHEYNIPEVVWMVPYKLLSTWASGYVVKRQSEIPTPAKVRSWIQAFNTSKEPYVEYNAAMVSEELRALYDSGLKDGFMPWSASSSMEKYASLAEAFKKEY